jgi:hypothetical protein
VIVAVLAMAAMRVTLDDVIDVAVVRDRDVLAPDAVLVIPRMRVAVVAGAARRDVVRAELVLVDVIAVRMVQVAVVHVIDVAVVHHRDMAAVRPVVVLVPIMDVRL